MNWNENIEGHRRVIPRSMTRAQSTKTESRRSATALVLADEAVRHAASKGRPVDSIASMMKPFSRASCVKLDFVKNLRCV